MADCPALYPPRSLLASASLCSCQSNPLEASTVHLKERSYRLSTLTSTCRWFTSRLAGCSRCAHPCCSMTTTPTTSWGVPSAATPATSHAHAMKAALSAAWVMPFPAHACQRDTRRHGTQASISRAFAAVLMQGRCHCQMQDTCTCTYTTNCHGHFRQCLAVCTTAMHCFISYVYIDAITVQSERCRMHACMHASCTHTCSRPAALDLPDLDAQPVLGGHGDPANVELDIGGYLPVPGRMTT